MAEASNQTPAPLPTAEEVAAHNAAIKAKVADQDAAGNPTPDPLDQKAAGDALDALLKKAEEKAGKEVDVEPVTPKPAAVEPKTEDDPAAKAAAEEAAKKEAAEKEARETELKKADEFFKDSPSLPQGASVKSHEAFSTIKLKAAQEISKYQSEVETLKKQLADAAASAGKVPADVEQKLKEAEELKKWRAKLDVEFDPQFKVHDQEASQSREFIYDQLKKGGISDAVIETIKKYGGPDKVLMKPILEALKDTSAQRLVEAELATIEKAKYKKEQIIAQTKQNLDQYIKAKDEESTKATTLAVEDTKKELDAMWKELPWTKPQTPKQGATPEEKAAVDNHNKFVDSMRQELDAAIKELHTPKMRATLLTAAAQLFNLQSVYKLEKEAREKLETEVKELREFKSKFKNATRSRLPESQAPSSGTTPLQKPVNQFTTSAADGIDALARQVMAERAAKGQ